jgi:hypothetical protein
MDYLRWAAEFQYNVEHEFYQFILQRGEKFTLANKFQVDDSKVEKLRPALKEGGPLFNGEATSSALRNYSYAWRRVVDGLTKVFDDPSHKSAALLLTELNVGFRKGETSNSRIFFIIPDPI